MADMNHRKKSSTVIDPTWEFLRSGDKDPYGAPSKRKQFFKKWPGGVLVRQDAGRSFHVACSHKGCTKAIKLDRVLLRGDLRCLKHRVVHVLGHPVTAPHLVRLRRLIIKADLIKKKDAKKGHYHFFIECDQQCGRFVDITHKQGAHKRRCKWCAQSPGRLSKGFDKKTNRHPSIVGYMKGRLNDKEIDIPLTKCSTRYCVNRIRFYNHTPGQTRNKRICIQCHAKRNRKKPFQSRFENFVKVNEKQGRLKVKFGYKFYLHLIKDAACHYCGHRLPISPYSDVKSEFKSTGIMLDRRDNRIGYTKGNVVPCCPTCNMMKGYLIPEELMHFISAGLSGDPLRVMRVFKKHKRKLVAYQAALKTVTKWRSLGKRPKK